jgi:hypothetical protein
MNIKTPILTTIALALVAATPAAASVNHKLPMPSDAKYAVPAGQVEHSVTVVEVSGTKAVASHMRHELWLSRHRARSVITDVTTGKVVRETLITRNETRTYSAKTRWVTVQRIRSASLPWNSMRFEAAVQRAYVAQGITKVIGETTVRGRRALVVESVPGKWVSDQPDDRTVAVVDAETYELYERTSTLPDGEFTQKETTRTRILHGRSARGAFVMGTYKGAKVYHLAH